MKLVHGEHNFDFTRDQNRCACTREKNQLEHQPIVAIRLRKLELPVLVYARYFENRAKLVDRG